MGKRIDITNQRFGRLIAIESAPSKSGRSRWKCKCDCGTYIEVDTADLKRGHTKSCGCYQRDRTSEANLNNLLGQKFGYLEVLERDNSYYGKDIKTHWICLCHKCGQMKSMPTSSLLRGAVSCGCLKSRGEYKIMELLKENQIKFISEYRFEGIQNRRYDFAILDDMDNVIRLIEFDGLQHFLTPRAWHWTASSSLEDTQQRDKQKNQIAYEKNIPLVRIPYWHLDKLQFNDLISDEFLIQEFKK